MQYTSLSITLQYLIKLSQCQLYLERTETVLGFHLGGSFAAASLPDQSLPFWKLSLNKGVGTGQKLGGGGGNI